MANGGIEQTVFGAQHFYAEHVYSAALKGTIDPPQVIGEQIDRYLVRVDGELDGWCGAVLRTATFD